MLAASCGGPLGHPSSATDATGESAQPGTAGPAGACSTDDAPATVELAQQCGLLDVAVAIARSQATDTEPAWLRVAELASQAGDWTSAQRAWEKLRDAPWASASIRERARREAAAASEKQAEAARGATASPPKSAHKAFERAARAHAAGNTQQAISELQYAAEHSSHPRYLSALGDAYWRAGKQAEARRWWAQARLRLEAAGDNVRMGTPGRPAKDPSWLAWDADALVVTGGQWMQRWTIRGGKARHQWSMSGHDVGPPRITATPGVLATSSAFTWQAWDAAFGTSLVTFRTRGVYHGPAEGAVAAYIDKLVRPGHFGLLLEQPRDPDRSQERLIPAPGGRYRAVLGFEELRIVDVASGKVIRTMGDRDHPVRKFMFPPAGGYLAISMDDKLRFETIQEGKPLLVLTAPPGATYVREMTFDPHGSAAIVQWDHSTLSVVDVSRRRAHSVTAKPLGRMGFSPNGQTALIRGVQTTLVDVRTGRATDMPAGVGLIGHYSFSPDSSKLVVTDQTDRTLHAFELPAATRTHELSLNTKQLGPVGFVDASTVAAVTESDVLLWNTDTGQVTSRFSVSARGPTEASSSGALVAIGRSNLVEVWDARRGSKLTTFPFAVAAALGIAAGGHTVAIATRDTLRLFDAQTGTESTVALPGANVLAVEDSGDQVAAASNQGVFLVDVRAGKSRSVSKITDAEALGFSRDGKLLALGTKTGEVVLVDIAAGSSRPKIEAHEQAITGVAFGPGQSFATSSKDQSVKLWDLPTGRPTRTLTVGAPKDEMLNVAFSPDGKTLAAGYGLRLVLWNAATGALIRNADLHARAYTAVFSRDGQSVHVGTATHVFNVPIGDGPVAQVHTHENDWRVAAIGSVLVARNKHGEVVVLDPSRASPSPAGWIDDKLIEQAPAELAKVWLAPSAGWLAQSLDGAVDATARERELFHTIAGAPNRKFSWGLGFDRFWRSGLLQQVLAGKRVKPY